jgi:hypothetical protein
MAITTEQLNAIDDLLALAPADRATLSSLHQLAPGISATRCDAMDLQDETPFRSYANCDLFLLDGRDHCVRITRDPALATGLIVAPKGRAG